jgi:uncharacterized protein YprB with RNaseH-like and TPR domain
MKRFKRTDSMNTVVEVNKVNYALEVKRAVPVEGHGMMIVDVYICDAEGKYDSDDRVIKIRGVDTLELQTLLIHLKRDIAALTHVHVQE